MSEAQSIGHAIQSVVAYIALRDTFWQVLWFYIAFVVVERLLHLVLGKPWNGPEAWGNVLSTSIGALITPFIGVVFAGAYMFLYDHARVFTIPWTFWGMVMAFLIWEALHYVQHRTNHRVALFWAFHHVHHSAQEMTNTVGLRKSWFGNPLCAEPAFLLLPILGVSFVQYAVIAIPVTLWGTFHHTRFTPRMDWLEHFVITPSAHRVHHGNQPKYIDKNYGEVLSIFDKAFGTFQSEEEEPVYGLAEQCNSVNPFIYQFAGFRELWMQVRSTPFWSEKIRYLIKPPGWRPNIMTASHPEQRSIA